MELANNLFQEGKGMRPDQNGVPKVVLTITDGLSNIPSDTKTSANVLKKREFNLISVGIKDPQNDPRIFLEELLVLSSTADDQYYLEDFNKIKGIINEITRKTCQQPAKIQTQNKVSTKVKKDSYKYFKYSLNATNTRNAAPKEITINLREISGSSEIFGSFDDPNPKSDDSFVKDIPIPDKEENFYEDETLRKKRQANKKSMTETIQPSREVYTRAEKSQSITVQNPNGSGTLYLSVLGRGEGDDNQFDITIGKRNAGVIHNFSFLLTLVSLAACFIYSN